MRRKPSRWAISLLGAILAHPAAANHSGGTYHADLSQESVSQAARECDPNIECCHANAGQGDPSQGHHQESHRNEGHGNEGSGQAAQDRPP